MWPLPALSSAYSYHLHEDSAWPAYTLPSGAESPSIRNALNRARRQLARDNEIRSWEVWLHTRPGAGGLPLAKRRVLCVGRLGEYDLTEADVDDAEALLLWRDYPGAFPELVAACRAAQAEERQYYADLRAKRG